MRNQRVVTTSAYRWRQSALRVLLDGLSRLIIRREIVGVEHVPAEGGCVLVSNHLSNFDTPLVFPLIRRPKITGLFAAEYRERTIHRLFVEAIGGRWIKRTESDVTAFRCALGLLEQGWLVAMSPEGRRSPSRALIEGKSGPAFLAMRAGVPVVPVVVTNTDKIVPSLRRFRRVPVTIRFGEPMSLPRLERGSHKQQLQAATGYLMARLAAMLPPEYRGVYTSAAAELEAVDSPLRSGTGVEPA